MDAAPDPIEEPDAVADLDDVPADTGDVDPDPVSQETATTVPVAPTVAEYENAFRAVADYPQEVQDEVEVNVWASLEQYPPDVREEAEANMKAALESVKGKPTQEPDAMPAADAMTDPEPVGEPYTVSEETPAQEPEYAADVDGVPADTADVESEPVTVDGEPMAQPVENAGLERIPDDITTPADRLDESLKSLWRLQGMPEDVIAANSARNQGRLGREWSYVRTGRNLDSSG